MPFKSKAQIGKIAELEKQGKVKKGTFDEFKKATPDMEKLPERISPPKEKHTAVESLQKTYKKRFGVK